MMVILLVIRSFWIGVFWIGGRLGCEFDALENPPFTLLLRKWHDEVSKKLTILGKKTENEPLIIQVSNERIASNLTSQYCR